MITKADNNLHRQAIVRALIASVQQLDASKHIVAFTDSSIDNDLGDTCAITKLFFPRKLSEMIITYSNYGPLWMGMWLDCTVKLDDERDGGHGNTLFPRWLAEVLNENGLNIKESDVY